MKTICTHLPTAALPAFAATTALLFSSSSADAANFVSSSFDLDPGTNVDTTGTADWGYFIRGTGGFTANLTTGTPVNFDALTFGSLPAQPATVSDASPSIGEVFYTATDSSSGGALDLFGFTFDTDNDAGQAVRNVAAGEEVFSMKFNDLGAGIHTMTFYAAHDNTSRRLNIDYFVYEDDDAEANPAALSATGVISNTLANNRVAYTLTFETTTANTDLVFNLGSAGSGTGGFTLSGYTISTVPEPGSLALLGMGGLLIGARRRKS